MGDAFDDWLIEKIQCFRRGSVVASGIRRLEQILRPDGIFITKHPRRQGPPSVSPSPGDQSSAPNSSPKKGDTLTLEEIQQQEAEWRAKFVYELMIDKAPTAIVSLVGRKEYEQCAKDLYYFIQAPQQPDAKQCGFFIMRYMKQIIEEVLTSGSISLRSFFDKRKYSPNDIDDVRVEWADYLLDEHI